MKVIKAHQKPSALALAASFLCILALILFTDPSHNSSYALIFFILTLIFIFFFLYLLLSFSGPLSLRRRQLIIVTSIYLTVTMMFMSARSLDWLNILILLLASSGVIFYLGRRR